MTAADNPIICDLLVREELDALLITSRANLRYLCGFSGSDGVLLIAAAETVFLTDGRYQTQAHDEVSADRIICYRTKLQGIKEILETGSFRRVGFEAADLSVAMAEELRELSETVCWCPIKDQLRSLRSVKSDDELALLRRAATLNQQAFEQVLPLIRPGISERDLALELEIALKRAGGEVNAFDFIVASGDRGALPHGIASAKKIAAEELVTIDFGTRIGGYYSDESVTLAVGAVDGKLRQIFAIVLEAQQLAMDAVRPGLPIAELDTVARDFIIAHDYGDYFTHGLGHGLGLEVHEFPALNGRTTESLQEGMVVTIEPGIYLPGIGGVRIEDTVAVTATGYERLTAIPKEFRQV